MALGPDLSPSRATPAERSPTRHLSNLSLAVSALALLVSTASAIVSVVARRDRSVVRLDLRAVEIDDGPRTVTAMLVLRVVNRGRRPCAARAPTETAGQAAPSPGAASGASAKGVPRGSAVSP